MLFSRPVARPKPQILVVDDKQDIRSSLRMILEYEGMDLTEAASGPEALKQVDDREPDAVLLDIKMGRMDGLEVLAELGRRHPDVPTIMISGHGTISTDEDAVPLPSGVKCYAAAAVLATKRGLLSDRLIGDGLVPLDSALGRHRDVNRSLKIPKSRQWVGYELGHRDLLSHPDVYAQLRRWL